MLLCKLAKSFCIIAFLLAVSYCLQAQEKIYFKANKVEEWKVTAVTPESVKYTVAQNPGVSYSTGRSNVLFVFNSVGNFLVPSKLGESGTADKYINNFLYGLNKAFNESDRIITLQNNLVTCNFDSENDKEVLYTIDKKQAKIAKADVAVIIFKNGDHKVFADINKVYQALGTVQDKYNELAFGTGRTENADPAKNNGTGKTAEPPKDKDPKNVPGSSTGKVEFAGVKTGSSASSAGSRPPEDPPTNPKNNNSEVNLDAATMVKLQELAILNTGDLGNHMQRICNESDLERVKSIIDDAVKLFYSDSAQVETTTLTGQKRQAAIRIYLNRLKAFRYTRVLIEWSNAHYASKLRLDPDGNYFGLIEFEQKFTGFGPDKKVMYSDVTRKKIEVRIKKIVRKVGGKSLDEWDVFLGDIGVSDVKPA